MPVLRPEIVVRKRLLENLEQMNSHKVGVVSAPAGFGKSTLVSEWIHQTSVNAAWLSLDENDNEPLRFFRYLIAAIQTLNTSFCTEILRGLDETKNVQIDQFVELFVNELSAFSSHIFLVLDDAHVLKSEEIFRMLSFIIDYSPSHFHLIILSRHDPDIPLYRYRARGQLLEIRLQDIRFSQEETSQFLNTTLRLRLSDEQISLLSHKTEGWIAGLQMAALTIQRTQQISNNKETEVNNFVKSFAGTNSFIIEYLMEEVLARLDADTRNVIEVASLFDEFSAELLDYVRNTNNSDKLLHKVFHSNLFIISLDHSNTWFRLHHLFRELLEHFRKKTDFPAAQYLERGSIFLFSIKKYEDACKCTLVSNSPEVVETICIRFWKEITELFDIDVIKNMMNIVRQEKKAKSAQILYLQSLIGIDIQTIERGKKSKSDALLALEILHTHPISDIQDQVYLEIALYFIILYSNYYLGLYDEVLEIYAILGNLFKKIDTIPISWWFLQQSSALQILAHVMFIYEKLDEGVKIYEQIVELFKKEKHHEIRIGEAMMNLARSYIAVGRISEAETVLQEAIETYCDTSNITTFDNRAHAFLLLSRLALDVGNFHKAEELNDTGIEVLDASLRKDPAVLVCLLDDAYFIAVAMKKEAKSIEILQRYDRLVASKTLPVYVPQTSLPTQGITALRCGRIEEAHQWAAYYEQERLQESQLSPSFKLFEEINYAHYCCRVGKLSEAHSIIEECLTKALSMNYIRYVPNIKLIMALLYKELAQLDNAEKLCYEALQLCFSQNNLINIYYFKPILSELILTILTSNKTSFTDTFRNSVMTILDIHDTVISSKIQSSVQQVQSQQLDKSIELTEREREALQLLALGYSNQKIADKLYISKATIKTHLHNLFQKLEVKNRTEAVMAGKKRGFLL